MSKEQQASDILANGEEERLQLLETLVQPGQDLDPLARAHADMALSDLDPARHLNFLLMLWACFAVHILVSEEVEAGEDGTGEGKNKGGRERLEFRSSPILIPVKEGWTIHDYGYYLCTSAGSHYSSYCLGPLLRTIPSMIAKAARRGALSVQLFGSPSARRLAWQQCIQHGLHVKNFEPSPLDKERYERLSAHYTL